MLGDRFQWIRSKTIYIFAFLALIGLYFYLYQPREHITNLVIENEYVIISTAMDGVRVLNKGPNNSKLEEIGYYDAQGYANDFVIEDSLLYLAEREAGFTILDLENIPEIKPTQHVRGKSINSLIPYKNFIIAATTQGLAFYRLQNGKYEWLDGKDLAIEGGASIIRKAGDRIYFIADKNTIKIYSASNLPNMVLLGSFTFDEPIENYLLDETILYISQGTAGMAILDISDPTQISEISRFSQGNIKDTKIIEHYAILADYEEGLIALDISDIYHPSKIGEFQSTGDSVRIDLSDSRVYLANSPTGVETIDLGIFSNISVQSRIADQVKLVDISVQDRYAYLASGEGGVRIIDINNPSIPEEVHVYDAPGFVNAVHTFGEFLYIANKQTGLSILQNSNLPESADLISQYSSLGGLNDVTSSESYILVAKESGGIAVLSQDNIQRLAVLGEEDTPGQALRLFHIDTILLVADGSGGLRILDISDPELPTEIGSILDVSQAVSVAALHHQGRIYAYIADLNHGIVIYDITNARLPNKINNLEFPTTVNDIYLIGNTAYISTGTDEGLYIFDVSNPKLPVFLNSYADGNQINVIKPLNDKLFCVSSEGNFLVLYSPQPSNISKISEVSAIEIIADVAINGSYIYGVDKRFGLRVFDFSVPKVPREIFTARILGTPKLVKIHQERLVVASSGNGLYFFNISEAAKPRLSGIYSLTEEILDLEIKGNLVFMATKESDLITIDISNPEKISRLGTFSINGLVVNLEISGNYLYASTGTNGLWIANISNPNQLISSYEYRELGSIDYVEINQNLAYVVQDRRNLITLNVQRPLRPKIVMGIEFAEDIAFVTSADEITLLVSLTNGNTYVIDVSDPSRPNSIAATGEFEPIESIVVQPLINQQDNNSGFNIVSANLDRGITYYSNTIEAKFDKAGSYITPGYAGWRQIRNYFYVNMGITSQPTTEKAFFTITHVLLDWIVIGLVGVLFWGWFFLQQSLTAPTVRQRIFSIFIRIFAFSFGLHGPFGLAVEGKPKQIANNDRYGLGIIRSDVSTAVVIENRVQKQSFLARPLTFILSRLLPNNNPSPTLCVANPGLSFTSAYLPDRGNFVFEGIKDLVDLRNQVRLRTGIRAFTRDGVEIETNIYAVSTLGLPPELLCLIYIDGSGTSTTSNGTGRLHQVKLELNQANRTLTVVDLLHRSDLAEDDHNEILEVVQEYLTNGKKPTRTYQKGRRSGPYFVKDDRVVAAVLAEPQQREHNRDIRWSDLPTSSAVKAFRDILSRENYDALYELTDEDSFPMEFLKRDFLISVRNQGVLGYRLIICKNRTSLSAGDTIPIQDLEILPPRLFTTPKDLRSAGIRVLAVGFSEPRPINTDVKEHLIKNWKANWQKIVDKLNAEYDYQAAKIISSARVEAQQDMIFTLSSILKKKDYSDEALMLRIYQSLESVAADPETRKLLPSDTIRMMRSIKHWLLPDSTDPQLTDIIEEDGL